MPRTTRSNAPARVALAALAAAVLLAVPAGAAPTKLKLGNAYFSKQTKAGFGGFYLDAKHRITGGTIARRFTNSKGKTCKLGTLTNGKVSYLQFTLKQPSAVSSSGAFSFKAKSSDTQVPGTVLGSGTFASNKTAHLTLSAKTSKGCKARFSTRKAKLTLQG